MFNLDMTQVEKYYLSRFDEATLSQRKGTMLKSMVYMESHGGECCGRRHIFEFKATPNDDDIKALRGCLRQEEGCRFEEDDYDEENPVFWEATELCSEITLTQHQVTNLKPTGEFAGKNWHQILTKEFGFDCVYIFVNPNTDNKVYVYLYSSNRC